MRRNLPLVLVALAIAGAVFAFLEMKDHRPPDVPFVTTPPDVVDAMIELAEIKKDDIVYDLGCGDGRLAIAAAKKRGCKAAGYDIDPDLVEQARSNAEVAGVQDLARFRHRDIYDLDLGDASVVLMYLTPNVNERLIPKFERMKPGARIVSHYFSIPGLKPTKVIQVKSAEGGLERPVYLWVAPVERK